MPRDEDDVILGESGAGVDLGPNRGNRAEALDCFVDEVAVQVQHQAAPIFGSGRLAPAVLRHRAPSLPTEFGAVDLAESARSHGLGQRRLHRVIAPILEHGEQDLRRLSSPDDVRRLVRPGRQRLVNDHGQTAGDRGQRLGGVGPRRGGEHDRIHVIAREQGAVIVNDRDTGVVGPCLGGPFRIARCHHRDPQSCVDHGV